MSNLDVIYNYLTGHGFSANAAYGVLGNIKAESGGNTSVMGDGGTSSGICQWHAERFTALKNFAQSRGQDWTNLGLQLDFMMHELQSSYPGLLNMLQTTTSMEHATRAWMTTFERPADTSEAAQQGRVNLAQDARKAGVGGGDSGGSNARTSGDGGGGGGGGGGGNKLTTEDYGFLDDFLDAHPAVKSVVQKAVNQEWSQAKFEAEIKDTEWWKRLDASERSWSRLIVEDPAEAARLQQKNHDIIAQMAKQMGVDLSKDQIDHMALAASRKGLEQTEIQAMVGAKFKMPGKKAGSLTGQSAVNVDQLRQMADEYGVGIGDRALTQYNKQILQGNLTVEGYKATMADQAKKLYPGIRDDLDRGYTVRQLADPYLQQAQTILGESADMMDLRDNKWSAFLRGKDPMSLEDAASMVRTQKRYGYDNTVAAKNEAGAFIRNMGQLTGTMG